jgi:hypothetical protein
MDRKKLQNGISTILKDSARPLKAKEIRAIYCSQNKQASITVKDINSILYSELRHVVNQDASFQWAISKSGAALARRRQRNGYGKERAEQHIREAKSLSVLLGGTDEDVKRYFFALRESELKVVLDEYEKKYGSSKREYAETILPTWRSGRRQMSGMVAERLFSLLPPRMPLPVKYDMVQTLWEKFSPRSNASFVIGPDCDSASALQIISQRLVDSVAQYKIPQELENRFNWLSSGDVAVRQALLNHFLDQERNLIISDAFNRTQIFLKHFEQNGEWTELITQSYTIGKHRIELFFDARASGIKEGRATVRSTPLKTPAAQNSGCLIMFGACISMGLLACLSIVFLF